MLVDPVAQDGVGEVGHGGHVCGAQPQVVVLGREGLSAVAAELTQDRRPGHHRRVVDDVVPPEEESHSVGVGGQRDRAGVDHPSVGPFPEHRAAEDADFRVRG